MEHRDRADELEREAERLEQESQRLGDSMEQARSDWEARKSDSGAPGAADPESAGPHHIDAEDPATGKRYGQEDRSEEIEALERDEAPREDDAKDDSETGG